VAILPFIDKRSASEIYRGNEYLKLYPYIDEHQNTLGEACLWANAPRNPGKYCELNNWLNGSDLKLDPKFLATLLTRRKIYLRR
jgi:hypothetical protein